MAIESHEPSGLEQLQAIPTGELLGKRVIFFLATLALLILWIGLLVDLLAPNGAVQRLGIFLGATAALGGALVALAGALGSHRTTPQQNLGLMVLASALLVLVGTLAQRL